MKKNIYIILLFLLSISLYSQNKETKKDLKVGLVLSGGGAKGFAHIGAIRAIEEAGIRIDYVGGTSMGSIIGSLYASGYSVDSIEAIISDKEIEFDNYIQDEISRKSTPFYQKENDHKYMLRLAIKDKKIQLPTGLTNGQSILNQFSKYTQHVNSIDDFNQLPIPFLCIGTDLETGKQVILNSGYLPDAVRASASFPTLLKPVEIDGKLLVDGGIINNFPVDEVLAMGADVVIGIDVADGKLLKKEEINSVIDVLNQVVSYQMLDEEDLAKKNKTAVYIRPDIRDYAVLSFDKIEEIVQLGYDTSIAQIDALKAIAQKQELPKKEYTPPQIPEEFIINSVQIRGNQNYTYGYIIEKLQIHLGKKISFKKFFNGIDRLSATDNFTNIQHKILVTPDGEVCNIQIDVTENPTKTYVQTGIHYDNIYKAGVLLNLTRKHLLFDNDLISADVVIGEYPRYDFTYFVDNGVHLSVGLKSSLDNFNFDSSFLPANSTFDSELNYSNLEYQSITNQILFQAVYQDNFAVGIGAEHQYVKVLSKNSITNPDDNDTTFEKSNYLNANAYLKYDTFDDYTFPKKGLLFESNAKWHLTANGTQDSFKPFLQGNIRFGYAFTLGSKFTTQIDSEAAISFSENANPFLDFHLGGNNANFSSKFNSFHGYRFASFGNNSFLKTALSFRYEVMNKNYLSAIANFARAEQDIFEDGALFNNTKSGYALQYGIKTLAGPISLTYSYSPEIKKNLWYFNIGYWF